VLPSFSNQEEEHSKGGQNTFVDNGRGKVLMAASPTLRIRLVEAAEAITEIGVTRGQNPADRLWNPVDPLWPPRAQAAETLSVIARALPN
jgi:hypothetical protein